MTLVSRSLEEWSSKINGLDSRVVSIAMPYWAFNKIPSSGGVYVKWIPDITTLSDADKFTEILPEAEWAYVVTWDKM